jgi:hypothetical protein
MAIAALRNRIARDLSRCGDRKIGQFGIEYKRAVGRWLRGLTENNKNLVKDHIIRVTGADPSSHAYPRDGGDYLLVVTGITQSLQELADLSIGAGQDGEYLPGSFGD